ncbi:MAG: hypothetical protein MZV64_30745 [Ignavibacteriales bacterium]|nr:hypothetical protein [Ignavibacteriales bacterium]
MRADGGEPGPCGRVRAVHAGVDHLVAPGRQPAVDDRGAAVTRCLEQQPRLRHRHLVVTHEENPLAAVQTRIEERIQRDVLGGRNPRAGGERRRGPNVDEPEVGSPLDDPVGQRPRGHAIRAIGGKPRHVAGVHRYTTASRWRGRNRHQTEHEGKEGQALVQGESHEELEHRCALGVSRRQAVCGRQCVTRDPLPAACCLLPTT